MLVNKPWKEIKMDSEKTLKNIKSILKELPCQGQFTSSSDRCYQVNCIKCNALNEIQFANAQEIHVPLKDKIKNKFIGALTWINLRRKKTAKEVVTELKKLGFLKNDER